ncbi:melatonin receptor type 1B-B-like [Patiria miniata]|uniref:G-protein coupled receptors family 1 profile domain-containing protein n=1 Tax=Patiria miniata TaxID=46514 RepID=A0A914AY01_PATMI|nr:melatonin receptor type 1B-B-like [Patiria miniata]
MTEEQETMDGVYTYQAGVGSACVWVFLTILGFVDNLLVIWSVILSRKLRTVTNVFVVNLCVADLWTCLSYPWMVVATVSQDGWPISETPCIIAAVQFHTGLGTRLYSLAAIAFNRFAITVTDETYKRLYSPGRVIAMVAATWAVPCTVTFLPLIFGVGELGYDDLHKSCTDKDDHTNGTEYSIIQFVCSFIVPLTIVVISYMALYILQKRRLATVDDQPSDAMEMTTREISSLEITIRDVSEMRSPPDQEQAITKNLFIVFCTFTLLVSPFFISLFMSTTHLFAVYGLTIVILNSCVNPIIYAVGHPHFKMVLSKIVRCRYSEIPDPSYCLESMNCRGNTSAEVN